MTTTLKGALDALAKEHATPTHATRASVSGQVLPITRLLADVRKQMLEYRSLATVAELTDGADTRRLEHLQQTYRAAEDKARVAEAALRGLAKDFLQIDRYADELRTLAAADTSPIAKG